MKALIIDGEEIFRFALEKIVSVCADFDEIIDAQSEHEFLLKASQHNKLDLIVIHPATLNDAKGACLKLVKRLYPEAAIVAIDDQRTHTGFDTVGVQHIDRQASLPQTIAAIRRAMHLPHSDAEITARRLRKSGLSHNESRDQHYDREAIFKHDPVFSRLSTRQQEILSMAADGLQNKEIAARLSIAEGTVKAHMHGIFKILDVSNRTQAVMRFGAAARPVSHDITPKPIESDRSVFKSVTYI